MTNFSRRRFLVTAGVSAASAVFLKGCLGNPPETTSSGSSSPTPGATPVALSPEMQPETPKAKLGYLPIFESAALIIAKEKGFFAKYGMTEVEVSKQANWGAARDNVTIGSEAGGIDGGQWQMPMPYLITEGAITDGKKVPMYVVAMLNTQANAIAVSKSNEGKGIHLDLSKGGADYIKGFEKTQGRKFKAAYTFPKANQDFWIRYWFAAGGIDPDKDIQLLAVPPAETVQGMRNGTMDAFSTGDPWPYRIIDEQIGFLGGLTAQMWKYHPEEYLALRADWVDKNPKATKAVLKGLMEAQQWCDDPNNRKELATIVGGRNYFNAPEKILLPPFQGNYIMGDGQPEVKDFNMGSRYWKTEKGSVSYPYPSLDLWFLTESIRWGFYPEIIKDVATAKEMVKKVNREDLWREAAKEAGFTAEIPASTSRGVEKFFDGIEYDPENPEAYLKSLKIKRA